MKRVEYPAQADWSELIRRPVQEGLDELRNSVHSIIDAVKQDGDNALHRFALEFDRFVPSSWRIATHDRDTRARSIPDALREAVDQAIETITVFHQSQLHEEAPVTTSPGVTCWRRAVPVERVGLYIPSGTAPLFSTLIMLAVPAKLAGCREIAITTPAGPEGLHPAVAYAAKRLGLDEIYSIGGAQAIAALAFGTPSVRKVSKILGPGNRFVNEAKLQLAAQGIAIDLPAGPSEVLVIADGNANPEFVAADLLAQAEHGIDSQVVAVTDSREIADKIEQALIRQVSSLPRGSIATKALEGSLLVVLHSLEQAMAFANAYAPEHLILASAEAERLAEMVQNAGSVFLGYLTPESLGDYASGTNHVLPTGGAAVATGGVSLDTFFKKITFQVADRDGLTKLSRTVVEMARAEGLEGHARAVMLRLEKSI